MGKMKKVSYTPDSLVSFDREWNLHRGCSEWWYCTGIVDTAGGHRFTYQFTLVSMGAVPLVTPKLLQAALTDMVTGEHHYLQDASLTGRKATLTDERLAYADRFELKRGPDGFTVKINHKDFAIDVSLGWGKGAFWHCDGGKLYMGVEGDEKATTYYYSYPNMPTTGTLTFKGKRQRITGKTWFDKQGGNYPLTARESQWEWMSLRFHDGEEMMLFAFPHMGYADGTYITADGRSERLNDYTLTTTRTIMHSGKRWSAGWNLVVPGKKEERYTIAPIFDGNINLSYFEELCSVRNEAGEEVALAFVELLPGVLNEDNKGGSASLLKGVEF
ncbi:lipocalin-like domain-containing protein [Demequina pelophila]|uniref:lipocalin-like domain-containing protein n=1 Tax=Demequina pelophila TaxID=1638984 RepID=UPI0007824F89|nr:lipocalin-like domain-containing protein [Demequina pelophila]